MTEIMPTHEPRVTITLELDPDVAYQLAQFCKRSTYQTFYEMTEGHLKRDQRSSRTYKMIQGIATLRAALDSQGISPR